MAESRANRKLSAQILSFLFADHPLRATIKGRIFSSANFCHAMANPNKSNGYEDVASVFITGRGRNSSGVGTSVVAGRSQTLRERCMEWTPRPRFVAAFRARFPGVPMECAAVEDSDFFARTFDDVVAWGLFFLLDAEAQRRLIKKIAGVLQSGGRLPALLAILSDDGLRGKY